jgi:hypothetical protein
VNLARYSGVAALEGIWGAQGRRNGGKEYGDGWEDEGKHVDSQQRQLGALVFVSLLVEFIYGS